MAYRSSRISWSSVMRDIRASGPSKEEFRAAVRAENDAKAEAGRAKIGVKQGLVTGAAFNVAVIMAYAIGEARLYRRNEPALTWNAALSRGLRWAWSCAAAARRLTVPAVAPKPPIPAALRAGVLARAWDLFRTSYNFPRISFRSIGRDCFTWALKAAWAEARETARLALLGVAKLREEAARIAQPRHRVGLSTSYSDSHEEVSARLAAVRAHEAAIHFATAP